MSKSLNSSLGQNYSTNPDVGIYQHSGIANGFLYYAKWDDKYYDEDGFPLGDLDYFWIVDDYGNLVPRSTFLHTDANAQHDGDLESYYGLHLGQGTWEVPINFLMQHFHKHHLRVLIDFKQVGEITGFWMNHFVNELVANILLEDGQVLEMPVNQFQMNNVYSLTIH